MEIHGFGLWSSRYLGDFAPTISAIKWSGPKYNSGIIYTSRQMMVDEQLVERNVVIKSVFPSFPLFFTLDSSELRM